MRIYLAIEKYSKGLYRGVGINSEGLPIIVTGRSHYDCIQKALKEIEENKEEVDEEVTEC